MTRFGNIQFGHSLVILSWQEDYNSILLLPIIKLLTFQIMFKYKCNNCQIKPVKLLLMWAIDTLKKLDHFSSLVPYSCNNTREKPRPNVVLQHQTQQSIDLSITSYQTNNSSLISDKVNSDWLHARGQGQWTSNLTNSNTRRLFIWIWKREGISWSKLDNSISPS